MTYNPQAANPFAQGSKEWSSNNLILKDAELRTKSGVTILDADVTDVFRVQAQAQSGGAASGAPFAIKNYGASSAGPYPGSTNAYEQRSEMPYKHSALGKNSNVPNSGPGQFGGGFPRHYYDNNKKW